MTTYNSQPINHANQRYIASNTHQVPVEGLRTNNISIAANTGNSAANYQQGTIIAESNQQYVASTTNQTPIQVLKTNNMNIPVNSTTNYQQQGAVGN